MSRGWLGGTRRAGPMGMRMCDLVRSSLWVEGLGASR